MRRKVRDETRKRWREGARERIQRVSSVPPPFFSFDLGYVFSRLYLFLYETQETNTPKNLPATKDILILDIRAKTNKFSVSRIARSHARVANERGGECEGPGKKGTAEVSSASSPTP